MSISINENLRQVCLGEIKVIDKNNLSNNDFTAIKAELEYVISSYDHDKNPIGLFEIGQKALNLLLVYKKENPRKLNQRILNKWGNFLTQYQNSKG